MIGFLAERSNNHWGSFLSVRVPGYPERCYSGYSKKDAIRNYRKEFNLTGKHIKFYEV